jgi:hypothetical protein
MNLKVFFKKKIPELSAEGNYYDDMKDLLTTS